MRKALLLLVVLAGFVTGCENKYKDPDPQVMGYDYYPLEVGDYRIYDVTDIKIARNVYDTTRYQLREVVDTSYVDQTNQLVYKIVRSYRQGETRSWVEDSVLVVSKGDKMVMLSKDNTKYVKLVFPIKEGFKWIVDAYNSRVIADSVTRIYNMKEKYLYSNIGSSFKIGNQAFENTVTVSPIVGKNDFEINDRKEVYAKGVGLVYRLFSRGLYCGAAEVRDCTESDEDFIQSGHERHEVLIANGKL